MENEDYVKKWLDGSLTGDEQKEFENTDEYRFLSHLDKSLRQFKAPEYRVLSEEARLSMEPRGRERQLGWNTWYKVAASVFLILGAVVVFLTFSRNDLVEMASIQKTNTYLPDSSFVSLNAHTSLSYRKKGWKEKRQIKLEGEAFFKVAKGSRFDVVTSLGTVSVLGTEFNVKSRDEYFEVACFEGKVRVLSKGREVVLEKNEVWRVLEGNSRPLVTKLTGEPDWLSGESDFQSIPLIYVIRELERQYNVTVKLTEVDSQRLFTGSFTHHDLRLALKSITLPMNISFKIEKEEVLLSGDQ